MTRCGAVLVFVAVASCGAAHASAQAVAIRPEPSLVVDAVIEYAAAPGMPAIEAPADALVTRLKELWLLPRDAASMKGRVTVTANCEPQIGLGSPSLLQPSSVSALDTAALGAVTGLHSVPMALAAYPPNRRRLVVTFYFNQLSEPGPVAPPAGWPPAGAFHPGGGVTAPKAVFEVRPAHSRLAAQAGIQGRVGVEAIVRADGTVGDAIVVRSLDGAFGVDRNAIEAVKQWRFVPGTRMGEPVAVVITIEVPIAAR
jgi:TonB family protein